MFIAVSFGNRQSWCHTRSLRYGGIKNFNKTTGSKIEDWQEQGSQRNSSVWIWSRGLHLQVQYQVVLPHGSRPLTFWKYFP